MLTDNEIIKALEHCSGTKGCSSCRCLKKDECVKWLMRDTLDLINRQKAEIERLQNYNENLLCMNTDLTNNLLYEVEQAKSEAYKEFAERLKVVAYVPDLSIVGEPVVDVEDIDDLVKELTGGNDNDKT